MVNYKILLVAIWTLFVAQMAWGQEDYFQQKVDVTLDVKLIDSAHTVDVDQSIQYTNNSQRTLNEIYFHLWANAFQHRNNDFTRQNIRNGNNDFYFAPESDFGGYQDISFKQGNQELATTKYNGSHEIVIARLNQPLKPGQTTQIDIDFTLLVPQIFSRLGHDGSNYHLTQWYPKPAVFDRDGWHPMNYLDLGEFYAEYGDYDVSIDLPKKFVVGATGELQNKDVREKWLAYADQCQEIFEGKRMPSKLERPYDQMDERHTLQYKASNVCDFAIFTSPHYMLLHDLANISSKTVDVWSYFYPRDREKWRFSAQYAKQAVEFYSEQVGPYGYPQVSVVEGSLPIAGGMEYPMITVVKFSGHQSSLDNVIAHEVGHNWFQAMLGFNERTEPWLDEGINSYFEGEYMKKYYPDSRHVKAGEHFGHALMRSYMTTGYNRPIVGNANDAAGADYFMNSYTKPAAAFAKLGDVVGKEALHQSIGNLYKKKQFQHVSSADLKHQLTEDLGNIDWWWNTYITSRQPVDTKAKLISSDNYSTTIEVTQSNQNAPVRAKAYWQDEMVLDTLLPGAGEYTLPIGEGDYDKIGVDGGNNLEKSLANNWIGDASERKYKWGWYGGLSDSPRTIFGGPILGYNSGNKWMAGFLVHNLGIPPKKFEFTLAPMFSFNQKNLNGWMNVNYHWMPDSDNIANYHIGLRAKKFNYGNTREYLKIQPRFSIDFLPKHSGDAWKKHLEASVDFINLPWECVSCEETKQYNRYIIPKVDMIFRKMSALNPMQIKAGLEFFNANNSLIDNASSLLADVAIETSWYYAKKSKIDARLYIGGFLFNNNSEKGNSNDFLVPNSLSLFSTARQDYRFDELAIDRQASLTSVWGNQIFGVGGGFRNYVHGRNGSIFGYSNVGLAALNLTADIPAISDLLPVKVYADFGYTLDKSPLGNGLPNNFLYSGGVSAHLLRGLVVINYNVLESKPLKDFYKLQGSVWSRFSFKLDLLNADVSRLIRKMDPTSDATFLQ